MIARIDELLFADDEMPNKRIAAMLKDQGYKVDPVQVRRQRKYWEALGRIRETELRGRPKAGRGRTLSHEAALQKLNRPVTFGDLLHAVEMQRGVAIFETSLILWNRELGAFTVNLGQLRGEDFRAGWDKAFLLSNRIRDLIKPLWP